MQPVVIVLKKDITNHNVINLLSANRAYNSGIRGMFAPPTYHNQMLWGIKLCLKLQNKFKLELNMGDLTYRF